MRNPDKENCRISWNVKLSSIGSLCWPHAKILFFVMDFHTCEDEDFVEHNFRCVMTYFDCNFIIIKLLSSNANKILEASVVHETKICATSKCLCNVWGCKMKPEAWRSWDSCLSNVFGLDFPLLKPKVWMMDRALSQAQNRSSKTSLLSLWEDWFAILFGLNSFHDYHRPKSQDSVPQFLNKVSVGFKLL